MFSITQIKRTLFIFKFLFTRFKLLSNLICFIELQEYDDAVSYLSKAAEAGREDSVAPWLEYIQYLKDTAG